LSPTRRTSPLRWIALLFVAACIAAAIGLYALFAFGRGALVELLRYPPWPLMLAPMMVALFVAVGLGRAWVLAVLGSIAVFWFGALGFVIGRADTPEPGARPVRVMTWNVEAFTEDRIAALGWEIALHDPDVLMLQDAGFGEIPEALRAALGTRHVHSAGQYLIASRWPLPRCALGRIDYRGEPHTYLRCTADIEGRSVELASVHLVTPRAGLNAARHEGLGGLEDWRANLADRLGQVEALSRDLAGLGRPLVLAGDLNAPEHSEVLQRLFALGLRDAFGTAGHGFGYTFGHRLRLGFSFLRIDHVLSDASFGIAQAEVGAAHGSDHRPVIADLWLRNGTRASALP
jgi:endonuclease/exonuclease/phosphatase (EEP) superfamily protein YafD